MSRDEALDKIEKVPLSPEQATQDKAYIAKKLDFTAEEFDVILAAPPKTFMDYPNNFKMIYRFRKPIILVYKTFLGSVPYTLTLMDHAEG